MLAGGTSSSLPSSERPKAQKDRLVSCPADIHSGEEVDTQPGPPEPDGQQGPLENKQQSELSIDASATCTSGQGCYPKRVHNQMYSC